MVSKNKFPIPEGVTEVTDDYQLNLAHYELQHLKPRGTILFAGETKEVAFQFFCTEKREDGIYAKFDTLGATAKRVFDYLEKYPRVESFITVTLLQFKLVFVSPRVHIVYGASQPTLRFEFPNKILKTHRRKFIRIPFNDSFPAYLTFTAENGQVITRKLRDLSREGMRLILENGDSKIIRPGVRLKQATLKVLNRQMPVGVTVVSVHDTQSAGARIIAISEEDKVWIKDCIRVLMRQILNLNDIRFDDQIERDKS